MTECLMLAISHFFLHPHLLSASPLCPSLLQGLAGIQAVLARGLAESVFVFLCCFVLCWLVFVIVKQSKRCGKNISLLLRFGVNLNSFLSSLSRDVLKVSSFKIKAFINTCYNKRLLFGLKVGK